MSVPKKRKTPGSVRQGRSHLALKKVVLSKCSKCGKAIKAHTACSFCGNYKNKEVIKPKTKLAKKK